MGDSQASDQVEHGVQAEQAEGKRTPLCEGDECGQDVGDMGMATLGTTFTRDLSNEKGDIIAQVVLEPVRTLRSVVQIKRMQPFHLCNNDNDKNNGFPKNSKALMNIMCCCQAALPNRPGPAKFPSKLRLRGHGKDGNHRHPSSEHYAAGQPDHPWGPSVSSWRPPLRMVVSLDSACSRGCIPVDSIQKSDFAVCYDI